MMIGVQFNGFGSPLKLIVHILTWELRLIDEPLPFMIHEL